MIFEPSAKLQRMLAWSEKLYGEYNGTWCELFKTRGYLKKLAIHERLIFSIRKEIIKESGMTVKFSAKTHRLHKFSVYGRMKRVGYRYIIECTPD